MVNVTTRRLAARPGGVPAVALLAAAVALFGPAALSGPATLGAQEAAGFVGLSPGDAAPAVELLDLDERPAQLLDYAGPDATLIEFWASWCPHCRALQPQIDRIRERHGDRLGIVAVAVAVSQTLQQVRDHVAEHAPGHPYLWDGEGAAVRAWGVSTTGVVVILDGEGRVAYTGVGSQQDLEAAVERVLAGS